MLCVLYEVSATDGGIVGNHHFGYGFWAHVQTTTSVGECSLSEQHSTLVHLETAGLYIILLVLPIYLGLLTKDVSTRIPTVPSPPPKVETTLSGEYPALFKTLAFIWASGVFVGRGMMALQGIDVPNTGFLPVLIGFWEWVFVFDDEWIRFYVDRVVNASSPHLIFCAREGKGQSRPKNRAERSLKLQWIKRTGADISGYVCGVLKDTIQRARSTATKALQVLTFWSSSGGNQDGTSCAPGNMEMEENTIGGQNVAEREESAPGLHKAQVCVRCWMALARAMTVLEWKFMYKFKPGTATEPESGTYNGAIRKRLPEKNFPAKYRYRLNSQNKKECMAAAKFLRKPRQLSVIYGMSIAPVHGPGDGEIPNLDDGKVRTTTVLVGLLILWTLGFMIKSRISALCFLLLPVSIGTHFCARRLTPKQTEFFECVSQYSAQIERISRHMHRDLVKNRYWPDRPIDVLLHYNGITAWCRCSPIPPGEKTEREKNDTWIEIVIPSISPRSNRVYEFLDSFAHSFLPWGHSSNWDVNFVYAFIMLLLTSYDVRMGAYGLAIPCAGKLLCPQNKWGEGDQWTLAWYIWILQWLTEGRFSQDLISLFTTAKSGITTGTFPSMSVTSPSATKTTLLNPSSL
ncbi:hypothetical protein BDV24DRAFT_161480 [Aspergillus arachidicola]|uniref:Uncharacterized protein n=1 Tax=Aspergillus arachidicola TaxID=656916 RepID=A0A5N6YD85_9EURO|nr:hypothetical protein BDV24DRAFT_161480 [Aspergillus arachidicola]